MEFYHVQEWYPLQKTPILRMKGREQTEHNPSCLTNAIMIVSVFVRPGRSSTLIKENSSFKKNACQSQGTKRIKNGLWDLVQTRNMAHVTVMYFFQADAVACRPIVGYPGVQSHSHYRTVFDVTWTLYDNLMISYMCQRDPAGVDSKIFVTRPTVL